jgi:hypothetical protein
MNMRGYFVFNFNIKDQERESLKKTGIFNSDKRKSVEEIVKLGDGKITDVEIIWGPYDAAAGYRPLNKKTQKELYGILSKLPDIEKESVNVLKTHKYSLPHLTSRPT